MAATASASFEGMETLLLRLAELIAMANEGTIANFLKAGAETYRDAVKREIQSRDLIDTGAYIGGIEVTGLPQGAWAIWTDRIYARVHEFGATITAKRGPYLIFQIDGQWVQVRSVTIPARPHWRPALETSKNAITSAIGDAMLKRLGEIAKG